MGRPLIVYDSFSKNTKKPAEEISRQTGGDIRELIPEKEYAFDYNAAVKRVRYEIENEGCPKLISGEEAVTGYIPA